MNVCAVFISRLPAFSKPIITGNIRSKICFLFTTSILPELLIFQQAHSSFIISKLRPKLLTLIHLMREFSTRVVGFLRNRNESVNPFVFYMFWPRLRRKAGTSRSSPSVPLRLPTASRGGSSGLKDTIATSREVGVIPTPERTSTPAAADIVRLGAGADVITSSAGVTARFTRGGLLEGGT